MQSELTGIVIIFGAALLVAWVMRAVRLPTILGFLLAGVALGPYALRVIQPEEIRFYANLGVVLLLFTVGLELSPEPLIRLGRRMLLAATLQVAFTIAAVALCLWIGGYEELVVAGIIGLVVAPSSTAILLKHLLDRNEVATPVGGLTTGISLLQDILVILALVFLPLLAPSSVDRPWSSLLGDAGVSLGGLIGVTILARLILPWVVTQVSRFGGRELMTLFAVVMACLGAWLADLAGWSWPLGACIAGLLLAQTDLRHQLCAEIAPFRDVFNALFFMSIGMLVDLSLFAEHPFLIAGLIVATLVAKTALTTCAVLCAAWPLRLAIAVGIGLCNISELGYVVAAEASRLGFLNENQLDTLLAVIVGTMLFGTFLLPVSDPLAVNLSRLLKPERSRVDPRAETRPAPAISSHVIILGYGINGANLARVLRATAIPYSVIEMNRDNARTARQECGHVIVGDAARLSILEAAGLMEARALVVSIAENQATRRIIAQARRARRDLYILARTRFVARLDELYRLGADMVIPEEFETSIEIFAHVLKKFAVPDNVVDQQIKLVRAGRYGMLRGRQADRTMRTEWRAILEAAVTQTFLVHPDSPACGLTIRELDLRAKSGVLIVAVTRDGKPTTNPSPDFRLEAGDVLVLVGSHRQLDEGRMMLESAGEQAEPAG